MFVPNHILVFL